MEKNDMPSKPAQMTEKVFNPNRAQRRGGVKAFMRTSEKKTRQLAANHPPVVLDRRKVMRQRAIINESTHSALP